MKHDLRCKCCHMKLAAIEELKGKIEIKCKKCKYLNQFEF